MRKRGPDRREVATDREAVIRGGRSGGGGGEMERGWNEGGRGGLRGEWTGASGLGFEHISSVLLSGREHIGAGQSPHGAPAAWSSSARRARARSQSGAPLRGANFPRGAQSQLLKSAPAPERCR